MPKKPNEETVVEARRPVRKTFTEESKTQQSFKDECDVNTIMAKYQKFGLLEHVNTHQGDYGEFLGYPDFHEAMNAVRQAEEMFLTIPSEIRAQFGNSPEAFLQFAQDENNHDRMVELGLRPGPFSHAEQEEQSDDDAPASPAPSPASDEA